MLVINHRKGSRQTLRKVPRGSLMATPVEGFAERLKALMEARGLKNPDVAKAGGVDPVTVSQWRSGRQQPSDATLERIAPILGTTAAFLRFGELTPDQRKVLESSQRGYSEPQFAARHSRNLPLRVREYLAELRLRLTKGGALEEEIDEAMELLRSPALFTFYKGGEPSEFNEEDVLRGMKAIAEGVVIPELRERGRKIR